jgi:hypothetical protein
LEFLELTSGRPAAPAAECINNDQYALIICSRPKPQFRPFRSRRIADP